MTEFDFVHLIPENLAVTTSLRNVWKALSDIIFSLWTNQMTCKTEPRLLFMRPLKKKRAHIFFNLKLAIQTFGP